MTDPTGELWDISKMNTEHSIAEQMRRLLKLVDGCEDARTVAALLQATTFYLDKITERRSRLPPDEYPISVRKRNRSVLH